MAKANQAKPKRETKLKTADGPYKIIFLLEGKEVTRDEVIAHLNKYYAKRRERDLVKERA
ncbi:MAG: hypothetical protein ACOYIF_07230 [Acetivibrionales bacterium]